MASSAPRDANQAAIIGSKEEAVFSALPPRSFSRVKRTRGVGAAWKSECIEVKLTAFEYRRSGRPTKITSLLLVASS
jgi:hypothetical protein